MLTDDLAAVAEQSIAKRASRGGDSLRIRRKLLVPAAEASGASLLHITEAVRLPIRITLPWIVTAHDLIPLRFPLRYHFTPIGYLQEYLRDILIYHRAHRIAAISHKSALDIQALLRVPSSRVDVIPLGIDLARWRTPPSDASERRARLLVGQRPYVVYAGYSDYRKNVEGMLAALAWARQRVDFELVWAGKLPDKECRKIERLAHKLKLDRHVRLLGYVSDDDLVALFHGATAHLFLSKLEGFGLTVAEAMAAGCPAVVARNSGSDELAGSGAMVVDGSNPMEAGNALVHLLLDQRTRQRLVDEGLRRIALATRESMARKYVDAYCRVLFGRPLNGTSA
ncbi:MAG: glycosyltransferase family 4 protein [Polyangiaceae bacterium]|nr:glycosyltransferase family 4 protein [Polyangiaceae bacterium]